MAIPPFMLTFGLVEVHIISWLMLAGRTVAFNLCMDIPATSGSGAATLTLTTFNESVSLLPPLRAVAVMQVFPAVRVRTNPVSVTVATSELLDVQRTLVSAFAGWKDRLSCLVSFTAMESPVGLLPIVTLAGAGRSTVKSNQSVLSATLVLAVILAVPGETAVILPFASTRATFVLLEVHATPLGAPAGKTCAVSWWVAFISILLFAGLLPIVTLVGAGVFTTSVKSRRI